MRRPELDAIRLAVVLGLVFFHSALVFDTRDDFYVKNAQTTEAVTWLAGLGVVWAMPALFLIAGLGSWHSIHRRGPRGFVAERLLRLGVPLVFATVTIVPVPQWLRTGAAESYPAFLRRFFDVHLSPANFPFVVRGEYFETGHLWFVVLLLAFSLMLAPLAAWLPGDQVTRVRDACAEAVAVRGVIVLGPAVPVAVIGATLGMEEAFAGWSRWAYLLFFAYGCALAADDRFRVAMRRDARVAAVAGVALFCGAGVLLSSAEGDPFTDMTAPAIVARILFGLAGWCWLVAILGLLDRGPRQPPPAGGKRAYLGTAALPLYVLHQPIVVVVAYFVVRGAAPMAIKYGVIVAASFVVLFAVYELIVRRTPLRSLFGVR